MGGWIPGGGGGPGRSGLLISRTAHGHGGTVLLPTPETWQEVRWTPHEHTEWLVPKPVARSPVWFRGSHTVEGSHAHSPM